MKAVHLTQSKPSKQHTESTTTFWCNQPWECTWLPGNRRVNNRKPPVCLCPAATRQHAIHQLAPRRLPSLLPLLASSHRKKGQPCFGNVNRVPASPSRLRLPAARTGGEGSGGVVWWAPCIVPPTTTDDMSIVRQTVFVRYLTSNQAWVFSPVSSANKIISHRNCQPPYSPN